MKLLTIIGARPQIIKAAAFSRAITTWNKKKGGEHIEEVILHTGQHYDDNMSAIFFYELGIPNPNINLHVGSGSHGLQTAKMIEGIENVLIKAKVDRSDFDGVVLYGDTNSTLAGAIAASKIHVPVFHIEAGLRSWNMAMPEEINRIVCDQLSNILFTPTAKGMENLIHAGFCRDTRKVHFAHGKKQYVVQAGDVMYDNAMYFVSMAEEKSNIIEQLELMPKHFVLVTIHRPANTDSAKNLTSIFNALLDIADGKANGEPMKIVLPLHPRTRKMLPEKLSSGLMKRLNSCKNLLLIEPISFFDIICLEKHAKMVMTDSGGVQKEAFFFETPSVIFRPETEWVEIIETGAGILADADYNRIITAYQTLYNKPIHFPPLYGDAHAAEKILKHIVNYCSTK